MKKKTLLILGGLSLVASAVFSDLLFDDEALAKHLCGQDNPYSCWSAGRYEHVRNDGHNETTLEFYEKSCDLGLGRSCNVMSGYYWSPNKQTTEEARDLKKAFHYIKLGCEKGDKKSCHNMGYMIRKGIGVEKSFREGVKIYSDLCAKGIADSCYNVGIQYANWSQSDDRKDFGFIDFKKALNHFIMSCELGLAEGCEEAAGFTRKGYEGEEGKKNAQQFLERARQLEGKPQKIRDVGPTHASRYQYFTCVLISGNGSKGACHPHTNVPQYVR